jgi:peptidoglycan/xylan/chitin deacetylase (PgdA/CDA1 family)
MITQKYVLLKNQGISSSMNHRILGICILLIIGVSLKSEGQKASPPKVKFTNWYQNKPGAVSITFDDACSSQYESAYPILEKYGIKATFSVIGEWVSDEPSFTAEEGSFEIKRMGWKQLIELWEHGNELAAHGFLHQKYNKHSQVAELTDEMKKIKLFIESHTPAVVYTMNYPYSFASGNIPVAAKEAGYLFGRTGLDTINPTSPENMYLLASQVILNGNHPDSATFLNWIDKAKGKWLILMYHHLFKEDSKEMAIIRSHNVVNSYSLTPMQFDNQIKGIIKAGYWTAPVETVGKYIIQRDNTEISAIRTRKKIYINTFTNLNKNVYNLSLTIEVEIPWKKVSVEGSRNDGIIKTTDNRIWIEVTPEKQVILTKESY